MKEKSNNYGCNRKNGYDETLHLVRSIRNGSIKSWHRFLEQYSGLIYSIIRRHLYTQDEDEIRNVYVDILEALYGGDISNYRGESKLSTWLSVYTKCRVVDAARKRYGRRQNPKGYERLSEFDRGVLRLFFRERLPLEIVIFTLRWEGFSATIDKIMESIQLIYNILDNRYLARLDREYSARRKGIDSVRTLRLLAHLKNEYSRKIHHERPDRQLLEKEALETAIQIRSALDDLTEFEQKIIHLRFYEGWTARRIAEKMEIKGERRVYRIIDKILLKLRSSLPAEDD